MQSFHFISFIHTHFLCIKNLRYLFCQVLSPLVRRLKYAYMSIICLVQNIHFIVRERERNFVDFISSKSLIFIMNFLYEFYSWNFSIILDLAKHLCIHCELCFQKHFSLFLTFLCSLLSTKSEYIFSFNPTNPSIATLPIFHLTCN